MTLQLERYLREQQVLEVTTLSRATLWREIKAGRFPRQVRLSPGRVGWRVSEVTRWLADPVGWQCAERV